MQTFRFVIQQNIPNTLTYKVISPTRNNFEAVNIVSRDDIWDAVGADILQEKVEAQNREAEEKAKKKAKLAAAKKAEEARLKKAQEEETQRAAEEKAKEGKAKEGDERPYFGPGGTGDGQDTTEAERKEQFSLLNQTSPTSPQLFPDPSKAAVDAMNKTNQGQQVPGFTITPLETLNEQSRQQMLKQLEQEATRVPPTPDNVAIAITGAKETHAEYGSYGVDSVVLQVVNGQIDPKRKTNQVISPVEGVIAETGLGKIRINVTRPPAGFEGQYVVALSHSQALSTMKEGTKIESGELIGFQVPTQISENFTAFHQDSKAFQWVDGKLVPIEKQEQFFVAGFQETYSVAAKTTAKSEVIPEQSWRIARDSEGQPVRGNFPSYSSQNNNSSNLNIGGVDELREDINQSIKDATTSAVNEVSRQTGQAIDETKSEASKQTGAIINKVIQDIFKPENFD